MATTVERVAIPIGVEAPKPAVSVLGLRKSYGSFEAVRGIDFEIWPGEIFALLGPNGAGKTTTVEILEGYRTRNGGEVSVLGCDPASERLRLKPRIGIVLQSTGVEPYLRVRETLEMYAGYYAHPRPVDEVIDLVGLTAKRDERVVRLSGGQQRRLDMAIAFAGDPELLFLDEPTTGFDPSARHEAWDVVKNLASLRQDGRADDSLHGRGAVPRRPGGRDRRRPGRRARARRPPSAPATAPRRAIRYRLPVGVSPPAGLAELCRCDGFVECAWTTRPRACTSSPAGRSSVASTSTGSR